MYFCNHVKTTNTISKMRRKIFLLLLLVTGIQAIAQTGNIRESKNHLNEKKNFSITIAGNWNASNCSSRQQYP